MPWIKVDEPWSHVESPARTVEYLPGNHNVTAEIEAAFEARSKPDDGADNSDTASGSGSVEGGANGDSAGEGGRDISSDDA